MFGKKQEQVSQTYPDGLPKDFFSGVYETSRNYPILTKRVSTGPNYHTFDGLFRSELLSKDLYFGEHIREGVFLLELKRNYLRVLDGGFIYSIRVGDTITKTLEETLWVCA